MKHTVFSNWGCFFLVASFPAFWQSVSSHHEHVIDNLLVASTFMVEYNRLIIHTDHIQTLLIPLLYKEI